jgi:ElaB/YqjD/DUF883 family membrane-anchored ribosome-binding protein
MPEPVELYARGADAGRDTLNSNQLAELRSELAIVATEFAQLVEAKASEAKDYAVRSTSDGIETTRNLIRAQPVVAMATAAVAGACLALIFVPKANRPTRLMDRDWDLDSTKAELNKMIKKMKRSLPDANRTSIASSFERVMDSVANVDPKASLVPIWEKLGPLLQSFKKSTVG